MLDKKGRTRCKIPECDEVGREHISSPQRLQQMNSSIVILKQISFQLFTLFLQAIAVAFELSPRNAQALVSKILQSTDELTSLLKICTSCFWIRTSHTLLTQFSLSFIQD